MPAFRFAHLILDDLRRRVVGCTAAAQLGHSGSRAIDLAGTPPHARGVAIGLGRRRAHSRSRGTSAVEFALVGPTAFLLLLGAVVLGVVVTHEIQLSQAVRDSARAAAICGSDTGPSTVTTLPDGTPCTTANITAYINARVDAVSPTLANQAVITVFNTSGSSVGTSPAACVPGYTIQIAITYQQPLFVPLVGAVVGNASTNTRTISAQGEATCEQ
jgi:Flp pilus assembly protein TadG